MPVRFPIPGLCVIIRFPHDTNVTYNPELDFDLSLCQVAVIISPRLPARKRRYADQH
jgi:hypothetical protein